jgi:hypothetical protein
MLNEVKLPLFNPGRSIGGEAAAGICIIMLIIIGTTWHPAGFLLACFLFWGVVEE